MTKLELARRAKGLTQQELEKLTGVTQVTISKAETGKAKSSYSSAKKLAAVLEIPMEELFDTVEL